MVVLTHIEPDSNIPVESASTHGQQGEGRTAWYSPWTAEKLVRLLCRAILWCSHCWASPLTILSAVDFTGISATVFCLLWMDFHTPLPPATHILRARHMFLSCLCSLFISGHCWGHEWILCHRGHHIRKPWASPSGGFTSFCRCCHKAYEVLMASSTNSYVCSQNISIPHAGYLLGIY